MLALSVRMFLIAIAVLRHRNRRVSDRHRLTGRLSAP